MNNGFVRFLFLMFCIRVIGFAIWFVNWAGDWLVAHDCKWLIAVALSVLLAGFFTFISSDGGRRK